MVKPLLPKQEMRVRFPLPAPAKKGCRMAPLFRWSRPGAPRLARPINDKICSFVVRGKRGDAYPTRRSASSLARRRVWVYSPKAKYPLPVKGVMRVPNGTPFLWSGRVASRFARQKHHRIRSSICRANAGALTPPEDRQARLAGAGCGYFRLRRSSRYL